MSAGHSLFVLPRYRDGASVVRLDLTSNRPKFVKGRDESAYAFVSHSKLDKYSATIWVVECQCKPGDNTWKSCPRQIALQYAADNFDTVAVKSPPNYCIQEQRAVRSKL